MRLIKCDKGHWYDGEKYAFCPHCHAVETNQDINNWYEQDEELRKTQMVDEPSGSGVRRTELIFGAAQADNAAGQGASAQAVSGGMQGIGSGNIPGSSAGSQYAETKAYLNTEHHMQRCLHCFEEYDTEHFGTCPYCGYVQGTSPRVGYHLHPGTVIGNRYVIGVVEGFGGFGITYRAWDTSIKSVVAIKEYYPAGIVNRVPGESRVILYTGKGSEEYQKGMDRFLEEARNTARFSAHPNFVHVYDFFRENETAYMIMELLRGETMESYTRRCGGRVPCQDAIRIYSFIAEAVGELHKNNIIHRDLSPDNFFICENGEVKLMDLGAARFASGGSEERTVILKIGLAPPEQYFKNGRQGPWTDVYALSASMYETLTGMEPEESTDRQVDDRLLPPTSVLPELPTYIDNVLMRGMALNPEYRFQSMEEFRKAIQNEEEVLALSQEIRRRKTRRALIIAAASILILAGVVFGVSRFRAVRQEAYLSKCTVDVWIPYDDSASDDGAGELAMYEDMSSEFRQQYPDVTIQFTPIPASEYGSEVEDALRDGRKDPTLFISSDLPDELGASYAPIDKAIDNVDIEDCIYFEEYEEKLRSRNQLPLGFEIITAYGNIVMAETGAQPQEDNNIADFLNGDSVLCIDSISRYYDVQDALPGQYDVLGIPTKRQYTKFDALWSVNDESRDNEKNAAFRLLSFWLGENAQDVYCIQNRMALPINAQKLSELSAVNVEEAGAISNFDNTFMMDSEAFEKKMDELYSDEELRRTLYETLKQDAKEQMNE